VWGVGAEGKLKPDGSDFMGFNREQQGQVIQHWYRRSFDPKNKLNASGVPDFPPAKWQPYRDVLHAAA